MGGLPPPYCRAAGTTPCSSVPQPVTGVVGRPSTDPCSPALNASSGAVPGSRNGSLQRDTGCLAARRGTVVIGTEDGASFYRPTPASIGTPSRRGWRRRERWRWVDGQE